MRFYVPEWDDAVDADYDFEHDELSTLDRTERDLEYIWNTFDRDTTPIDGVLISREQVEATTRKAERLKEHGVYDDPVLDLPEWLPTISDCGAWGYKSLPFPPYGNAEMLQFYETLKVDVGVTIDHLVLGSGKDKGRLYLDKRAVTTKVKRDENFKNLSEVVGLMIDEWPEEWPDYVDEYEPSIRTPDDQPVDPFQPSDFEGDADDVLDRLADDPRAVYRTDDKQFRYDLTLRNAREMNRLYQRGDYPFRLMVAIQGWDPESYVEAADTVLEWGYDYLGIGGVAGSPIHDVRKIVTGVGKTVKEFEREHVTRIDSHVFGFAKTDGFETVGRSGMTSFDSASMLRSAWTGGDNYRLSSDERYDAIRVQYPSSGATPEEAIETALRGRETLVAFRAYAEGTPVLQALTEWAQRVAPIVDAARQYLREHRHDDQYDESRLRDVETAFREDFEFGRELQAHFGGELRRDLVKLLRDDDPESPVEFSEYDELLAIAEQTFQRFPRMGPILEREADKPDGMSEYEQLWFIIQDYASWIGDFDLLEAYQNTIDARPWEGCDCPVCEQIGVEVCIFRGNDRNRRRGFHNTRRFYDEFARALPKTLVVTPGTASLNGPKAVKDYLRREHSAFWQHAHDLPVAEIGVLDTDGVHEWWDETPDSVSFAPKGMAENLAEWADRYQQIYVHTPDRPLATEVVDTVADADCTIQQFEDAEELRESVLQGLGKSYSVGKDFIPYTPEIDTNEGLDVLVIDQCSGSKQVPEDAHVFTKDEIDASTKEELLARDNVPGIAARDLYTGRQQEFVTNALRRLAADGHDVTRYFISAGFGLVADNELLPPYEVTFSSMYVSEIRERSKRLNIKSDLTHLLREAEYDLVFFTLGKEYYRSIDIDTTVQEVLPDRIGVVFNREIVDEQFDNIISVPARTDEAKRHGTIVVGLKGRYMENFARRLGTVDYLRPETIENLCRRIEEEPPQAGFESFN